MPTVDELGYTQALDYDGSNNLIYKGFAPPGSSKSAAVWAIQRYLYDGSGNLTDIQWAGGSPLQMNAWDTRASYSYS